MTNGGRTGSVLAQRVQALQDQLDERGTNAQIYEEAFWELRAVVDKARERMAVAPDVTDREWVTMLPVGSMELAEAV